MKNFEQELDDLALAKEGYNLQEINVIKKSRAGITPVKFSSKKSSSFAL